MTDTDALSWEGRIKRLKALGLGAHPVTGIIKQMYEEGLPLPSIGMNDEEVCLTYYADIHGIAGGVHIHNDGQYGFYLKGPKSVTERLESIIESALGLSGDAGAKP